MLFSTAPHQEVQYLISAEMIRQMILRALSNVGLFRYIAKLMVHHRKDKHNPDFIKDTAPLMPHLIPHYQAPV